MKHTIQIEFGDKIAADHFTTWLSEAGEQGYWDWMREREVKERGPITAVKFHYRFKNKGRHGQREKVAENSIIHTECGRLDDSK